MAAPVERYFFVVFAMFNPTLGFAIDNAQFGFPGMPSKHYMKAQCIPGTKYAIADVTLIHWQELSPADFVAFNAQT